MSVHLDDVIRPAAAWMLGSFIVTFLVTRGIVRMIRAGKGPFRDNTVGGVHVHHLVYGIFLMLISGALEFTYRPDPPWLYVVAAAFGAGASLTLDEYALWLHLEDVYWSREGQLSVDAVLLVGAAMALLVLGANPFDSTAGDGVVALVINGVIVCVIAMIALFKGRIVLGLLGLLLPPLALYGAIRLARPTSPWARWRYPEGSHKAARSRHRFPARERRRWDAVVETITGLPNPDPPAAATVPPGQAPPGQAPPGQAPPGQAPPEQAPPEQEGAR